MSNEEQLHMSRFFYGGAKLEYWLQRNEPAIWKEWQNSYEVTTPMDLWDWLEENYREELGRYKKVIASRAGGAK